MELPPPADENKRVQEGAGGCSGSILKPLTAPAAAALISATLLCLARGPGPEPWTFLYSRSPVATSFKKRQSENTSGLFPRLDRCVSARLRGIISCSASPVGVFGGSSWLLGLQLLRWPTGGSVRFSLGVGWSVGARLQVGVDYSTFVAKQTDRQVNV